MIANNPSDATDLNDIVHHPNATSDGHDSLRYHLLGPSLTKAGQDTVDQQKVST